MKIALVDNMNNNFFSLARYLRDLGMDIELFTIPGSSEHFQPHCDTYEDVSNMKWIRPFPVSYGWRNIFLRKNKFREFRKYELIVACGASMWLLRRAGIQPDVFIPYGSDLYMLPFPEEWNTSSSRFRGRVTFHIRWISHLQRKSIRGTRVIIANPRHGKSGAALKKLNCTCLNISVPMVYNKYSFTDKGEGDFDRYDFIIFNHSRHIWKSNPDKLGDFGRFGGNKRNDKIIKAFARFLTNTRFQSPRLVTFEYGPDVSASKQLVQRLGIEDYVLWYPLSPRKEIMRYLRYATFGVDQLRNGLSGIGGTGHECISMGVPLITHTNGAISDASHPFYEAPIVDILEEDELVNTFVDYEKNPEKYKKIGSDAKNWFDRKIGVGLAQKYAKLFDLLIRDRDISHQDGVIKDIFGGNGK